MKIGRLQPICCTEEDEESVIKSQCLCHLRPRRTAPTALPVSMETTPWALPRPPSREWLPGTVLTNRCSFGNQPLHMFCCPNIKWNKTNTKTFLVRDCSLHARNKNPNFGCAKKSPKRRISFSQPSRKSGGCNLKCLKVRSPVFQSPSLSGCHPVRKSEDRNLKGWVHFGPSAGNSDDAWERDKNRNMVVKETRFGSKAKSRAENRTFTEFACRSAKLQIFFLGNNGGGSI